MTFPFRCAAAAAALLAITSCGAPAADLQVQPGDGPKASADKPAASKPAPTKQAAKVATFKDKYTYPDGLQVEVTKIKRTKMGPNAAADGVKVGAPVQVLSIRVTNGTDKKLDVAVASGTMTYGPDGDEAPAVFDEGVDGMSGNVLPGKAKTGTYGFAVPTKYLGDATLEFTADFEHDPAIFSGTLK